MELKAEKLKKTDWAGKNLVYYKEVDSTNTRAMCLGTEGAVHGTLVVADRQNCGKGRRGRIWESPSNTNIYMSLLLRPKFEAEQAPMLTLVMAYSVAQALKENAIDVQIKWPNDIILNKKKICGILTEMSMKEQKIDYVVIGVGVNVNHEAFPTELEASATSIKIESGKKMSRESLIENILEKFEYYYQQFCLSGDLSMMVEGYNQILVNRGNEVCIMEPNREYHALSQGINHLGELEVIRKDGSREWIFAGEVSVRGIYGYV